MPSLTIRSVEERTLRWLRARAGTRGQSMNAELLDILRTVEADELAELHADHPLAQTFRKAKKLGISTPSSSRRILRADRECR